MDLGLPHEKHIFKPGYQPRQEGAMEGVPVKSGRVQGLRSKCPLAEPKLSNVKKIGSGRLRKY